MISRNKSKLRGGTWSIETEINQHMVHLSLLCSNNQYFIHSSPWLFFTILQVMRWNRWRNGGPPIGSNRSTRKSALRNTVILAPDSWFAMFDHKLTHHPFPLCVSSVFFVAIGKWRERGNTADQWPAKTAPRITRFGKKVRCSLTRGDTNIRIPHVLLRSTNLATRLALRKGHSFSAKALVLVRSAYVLCYWSSRKRTMKHKGQTGWNGGYFRSFSPSSSSKHFATPRPFNWHD